MADAPCEPWPLDESCWDFPADVVLDPEVVAFWQSVSTDILWALSGRRWGVCEQVVRPCRRTCMEQYITQPWRPGPFMYPYLVGGVWRNAVPCGCRSDCSCGELCEVHLPGPVAEIVSVTIDGVELDPSEYRVDAPGMLVRQGDGCWPSCQDMSASEDAEGTFVVRYMLGQPLTNAAIAANSELTEELIKSCTPGCKCRLPERVTSVTRAGMTMQRLNPTDFLDRGRTGLYLTDLWLNAVNPNSLPAPPRVMSPDVRPPRRQTWPV